MITNGSIIKQSIKSQPIKQTSFKQDEQSLREDKGRIIRNSDGTVTVVSPTRSYTNQIPSIELPNLSSQLSSFETDTISTPNVRPSKVKLPTIESEQLIPQPNNDLPMIPITYDPNRDIAIGDDKIERLRVQWYQEEPVIRIGTIADGSCFFHAILKAFYSPYANTSSYSDRKSIVQKLRRDLAAMLSQKNPLYPNKTYYESVSGGQWLELHQQSKAGVNLDIDFSLRGLKNLLNSQRDVGNEVYQYTADALQIDIYIMQATLNDLIPLAIADAISNSSPKRRNDSDKYGVIIAGNGRHYETVGLETNQGIQTAFSINHPFISRIRTKMDLQ